MKVTRLYTDGDGETHFVDEDLDMESRDFAPPAPPLEVSAPQAASGAIFFRAPAGWRGEAHPAPARQWALVLSGAIGIEASDGEQRRFSAGDLFLVEDTTGKGHVTWIEGEDDAVGVFIQLS